MTEYRDERRIELTVNGESRSVMIRPGDTLLLVLRRALGLTGTKLGCENGDCGACTVQRDGVPVKSCYTLAADVADAEITTIEGLRDAPLQRAFVEENGFQCGFCTPGFIMNAEALVRAVPEADDATLREWLESNICRCTGYETIENAVKRALRDDDEVAVERRLERSQQDRLRESLRTPHPDTEDLSDVGLGGWVSESGADDDSLVDPELGSPLRWDPDSGWKRE